MITLDRNWVVKYIKGFTRFPLDITKYATVKNKKITLIEEKERKKRR